MAGGTRGDRQFVIVTMLLVAAVTFAVALRHEPWRDEADVWLLMRDGGVGTMLARTGYLGTPPLWYLMVAPLPALGLPYFSMTVLNLVTAWGAMAVFLLFSPFSRWLGALFAQHDGSYMLWDTRYKLAGSTRYASAVAAAQLELAPGKWLLLVNQAMENPESYGFRLLFTNLTPPFEKADERYWLYAPLNWSGPPLPEVR